MIAVLPELITEAGTVDYLIGVSNRAATQSVINYANSKAFNVVNKGVDYIAKKK